MADLSQLEAALVKADAAGNAEDARALAGEIRRLRSFSAIKSEGQVEKPPTPFHPSGETALTPQEEVLGNPMVRGIIGAVKPFVGAGQLAANAVGLGKPVNEAIAETERNINRGRNYIGSTGFDAFQAGGQLASPLFLGAAGAMPATATAGGRIAQGAGMGALAGATEPVNTPDYWGTKAAQVGGGAVLGAAVPAAWELAKLGGRGVRNIVQPSLGEWGSDRAAGRLLNQVAGEKQPQVVQALETPKTIVSGSNPTAGQAALPAGSSEFSGMNQIVLDRAPSQYGTSGIGGAQNEARLNALRSVGGTTQDIYAADQARTAATSGMREANLTSANLLQGGVKSQGVISAISRQQNEPGIRASTIIQKVLGDVKDKIASLTNENGVIDAKDLYTIRKEIGNTIQQHAKETGNWDKRLASKLEGSVQEYIDNAIERSGGATWKDYLARYSKMSRPIEQMKAGQELEQKLIPALSDEAKQRAASYANALRETAPDIAETFTPRQGKVLGSVKSDLERDALLKALGSEGIKATREKIGGAIPEAPSPGYFNMLVSAGRAGYNRLAGKATNKILDDVAKNWHDPQKIAQMMKEAKPFERQALVDALMKYQAVLPAAASQEIQ